MSVGIGTEVERVPDGYHYDQKGSVVEETDTRIRVLWRHRSGTNDRRTWLAKDAEGKRWRRVSGGGAR